MTSIRRSAKTSAERTVSAARAAARLKPWRSILRMAVALATVGVVSGQSTDEATRLLREYVAIDTSNPPGDTRKAADFLASILEKEGIPVTRYEPAPGKAIVYGRLKATASPAAGKAILMLHHMDVVTAD